PVESVEGNSALGNRSLVQVVHVARRILFLPADCSPDQYIDLSLSGGVEMLCRIRIVQAMKRHRPGRSGTSREYVTGNGFQSIAGWWSRGVSFIRRVQMVVNVCSVQAVEWNYRWRSFNWRKNIACDPFE